MKTKKGWIVFGIVLAAVLVAGIACICIRMSRPKYSYKQINVAFFVASGEEDADAYMNVRAHRTLESLKQTVQYINLYNDMLDAKGKPADRHLSLEDVLAFYDSEYEADGEPRLMHLPKQIEGYLDWFWRHGFSKKGPKLDQDTFYEVGYITTAMYELGCYSEKKNTQQVADVVTADPVKFYVDLHVYNEINPTQPVTEDEIKAAMVGGPAEPLVRFGTWYTGLGLYDLKRFDNRLSSYYYDTYYPEHPDAPVIGEMDLAELQQLIACMEG